MERVTAVVLAGGASSRFGEDKLDAEVSGQSLLDATLSALPPQMRVIVVGPPRRTRRHVTFTREHPTGGGPAAGLVAGLRAAMDTEPDAIAVLPGDAPAAGRGALTLVAALTDQQAVVGTDEQGMEQPLQLALRPAAAAALVAAAGPAAGANVSARRLLQALDPPAVPHPLPPHVVFDIDTPGALRVWEQQAGPAVTAITDAVAVRRTAVAGSPVVVAIDGHSGTGKSTLAAALALRAGGTVLDSDDFYNPVLPGLGPAERARMSDAEVAAAVIDWSRLRTEALEPLRAGQPARFRPYDWERQDGRLAALKRLAPADLVIVEGVYSARPELADLVHLAVHLDLDPAVRDERLAERCDDPDWAEFWDRGEVHYFGSVRPPAGFDLRLSGPL